MTNICHLASNDTLQRQANRLVDASEVKILGGDDSSGAAIGVVVLLLSCTVVSLLYLSISTIVVAAIALFVFIAVSIFSLLHQPVYNKSMLNTLQTRHYTLTRNRVPGVDRAWAASRDGLKPDTSQLQAVYFAYVLGSGGHTGELSQVIKQQFKANKNLHRRYVISSGDTHSINAVARLETDIQGAFPNGTAGTWDVFKVTRARRVHQPLWTAPYSSLLSAFSVIRALLQVPKERSSNDNSAAFGNPHLIITNGPGTGFIICLVAHLLKIFYLVPNGRMKIIYIETWAHLTTLSLTGKLFYYTDIADLFMVQHKSLAERTGKRFVGEIAPTENLLGIKE